ncbi:hypothetical protein VUR80DRAFT_6222 [Thermomyces stellatus]
MAKVLPSIFMFRAERKSCCGRFSRVMRVEIQLLLEVRGEEAGGGCRVIEPGRAARLGGPRNLYACGGRHGLSLGTRLGPGFPASTEERSRLGAYVASFAGCACADRPRLKHPDSATETRRPRPTAIPAGPSAPPRFTCSRQYRLAGESRLSY